MHLPARRRRCELLPLECSILGRTGVCPMRWRTMPGFAAWLWHSFPRFMWCVYLQPSGEATKLNDGEQMCESVLTVATAKYFADGKTIKCRRCSVRDVSCVACETVGGGNKNIFSRNILFIDFYTDTLFPHACLINIYLTSMQRASFVWH